MEESAGEVESRANELYWDSDRSVNRIAEELDLSRGALYALIRPLHAGLLCPACGGELRWPNRTARERALVTCASCGREESEDAARASGRERPSAVKRAEAAPGAPRPATAPAGELRAAPLEPWERGILLAATVLAVSAALLFALRPRRR